MPAPLKPGLTCPECGETVLMIYHEWNGHDDTALFEYHHHTDAERDARGEAPRPCIVTLSYKEGMERFLAECP
jgi:hypothetical protein